LLDELVDCGAVRFGDFTLTSGKKSRYYVDVKKASSRPDLLERMTRAFVDMGMECDSVAGVELGAVPLIVAYSLRTKKPFIIIRKAAREHGTRSRIEGEVRPGEKVLLLEDVVTSGGSVVKALEALQGEGAHIVGVLSVVDREEGGTQEISSRTTFRSLVKASELLEAASRAGPPG